MDLNQETCLGVDDPMDKLAQDSTIVLLPTVFPPLPAGHGTPVGQCWDPSIGSREFIASLEEMSGPESHDAHIHLRWVTDSSHAQDWLDAVAVNLEHFTVTFVSHVSIADSLVDGSGSGQLTSSLVSADLLAPMSWVRHTIPFRLHHDAIRSTLKTSLAEEYDCYESRAIANFARPDDPPSFGSPEAEANGALWSLRPPKMKSAMKAFGLDSFLQQDILPPQVFEYQKVAIPSSVSLPSSYVIVPLETCTEFQDAIEHDSGLESPSKKLQER